jgi:uncharacterized protein with HEPN domain
MSERDISVTLRQMMDFSREAVSFCEGITKEQLAADRKLHLAVIRLVEMTGEAATRVPREFQDSYPQIEWAAVIGMRNRLTHGYDTVDFTLLWNTATIDMLALIKALSSII